MTTKAEAIELVTGYFNGTIDKATATAAALSFTTGEYMKNRNAVYSLIGGAVGSGTSRTVFKNGNPYGSMQIPANIDELAYVCGMFSDASTVNGFSCSLAQNTPIIYTPETGSKGIDISTGNPPGINSPGTTTTEQPEQPLSISGKVIFMFFAALIILFALLRRKS